MCTSEIERLLDIGRRAPSVPAGLAAGYLPSFESVVAVTSSTAAVMTTVGVYESARLSPKTGPQRRGLHVHLNQDRIAEAVISYADHEARLPPAIRFLDHAGGLGHTTYLTSSSDLWALECLALSATTRAVQREAGTERVFPTGSRKTQRSAVDRQVIPHVLAYLAALRLPLTIVLGNGSCMHCDNGPLEDISQAGDLVFVRMAQTTLSFDPVLIGGWNVRRSETDRDRMILEAVCSQNRRQFHITCGPRDCGNLHESWEAILKSLPLTRTQAP